MKHVCERFCLFPLLALMGTVFAAQGIAAQAPPAQEAAAAEQEQPRVPSGAAFSDTRASVPPGSTTASRERLYFSTEEDFLSRGPTPPDGNPLISDGDLLVLPNYPGLGAAAVFARNRELLQRFDVMEDVGLDAADVIDPRQRLVTFSTELDDPGGRFTAGDLLTTTGGVLPNAALLAAFDVPKSLDLGLDAVQLTGEPEAVLKVLTEIQKRGREAWLKDPGALPKLLEEADVDILFSTEGTAPSVEKPRFLDGDLLSARYGSIAVSNADFLPSLPAGLPSRGVDYGCDAFAIAWDPIEQMWLELFSTEIDSLSPRRAFTDGDVLLGGVVVALNGSLIQALKPVVDEVGLDALDYTGFRDGPAAMQITAISGVDVATLSSDGHAPNDLLDDATPATVKDRPFGYWLEIDGTLPPDALPGFDTDDYEYRIEFKHPSGVWRSILTPEHSHPGDPNWFWEIPGLIWPTTIVYSSDTDGWIELADYWRKADRRFLVVWDSREFGNGQSALRIALRNKHTLSITYSPEVPVYIDNLRPRHSAGAGPDIRLSGGFTDACSIPPDARTITISGEIRDEHFYRFDLDWHENASGYHNIAENFHDQALPHLDGTGTLPVGAYPVLGSVAIPVGVDCGHIYLRAQDRTIVGGVRLSPPGLPNDRVEVQLHEWWARDAADFCFDADAPAK